MGEEAAIDGVATGEVTDYGAATLRFSSFVRLLRIKFL